MRNGSSTGRAGLIVALIALVLAVSGAALGLPGKGSVDSGDIKRNAVKAKHIKNGHVRAAEIAAAAVANAELGADAVTSDRVLDDTLSGNDIDESSLGQVPSSASASNASSLGSVPAGSYQRECLEGAVRGHALVNGSVGFASTYTSTGVAEEFNCAGGAAQARRTAMGVYNVCFPSNFPSVAVASGINGGSGSAGEDNLVTWRRIADGTCTGGTAVEVRIVDNGGTLEDESFSVALL